MSPLLKSLFFWLVVRPLVLVLLGLNVRHRERLPESGPAILCANHNSHLDTLVLMTLLPGHLLARARPVAAADYFLRNRWLAWFARRVIGILPVVRGGGAAGGNPLAEAERALVDGQILILFPEGTRGEPERRAALKAGVTHLALKHPQVPLIPVFLHGLGKSLPKGAFLPVPFFCDVFVGKPLLGGQRRWEGDRHRLLAGLEKALEELAAEGAFPEWQ